MTWNSPGAVSRAAGNSFVVLSLGLACENQVFDGERLLDYVKLVAADNSAILSGIEQLKLIA